MYKLIALDMDGTLLNSDKQISEPNKEAIRQARAAGVTVVLASGRPLEGMQSKLEELQIDSDKDFVLFYNGSMVKNVATGEIIHEQIIDGKAAKKIARLADKLGVFVHAFSKEFGLITPQNNPYTDIEANINGLNITEMNFDALEDDHPIIKTMIVAEPSELTKAIAALPATLHDEFTIVQSAPFFLEFLNPASNKGIGVAAIAEYLGIRAEEVICMGDAENDHHMLKYAGLGIAMANAMEETKQTWEAAEQDEQSFAEIIVKTGDSPTWCQADVADYITNSNNDHGVATAIEKFVLQA
ncbi:Cof-type HAD-IIB family hydrolase [Vibrio vulnificus]|uniref:Cof-type HAD-IIB family hydrolase n=1 Tax=Vibrio vulnificus TaxID=672 RepID=UPI00215BFA96|nr:Cof-type HAD-IIB family hydrolase [Vibrio vulnificus]MCR9703984.1 Cof-type HAD-IIB family hydrolase [Vibrio vulnificus]